MMRNEFVTRPDGADRQATIPKGRLGFMTIVRLPPPLLSLFALFLCLAPVTAASAADTGPSLSGGDTAWILVSSVFTSLMLLPGLALFYGGMVRKKNVLAIAMQCATGCALVSLIWVVCGYSLVFSPGTPVLGGFGRAFLAGVSLNSVSPGAPTIPEYLYVMFELTFATITPLIVLGATADRMKFTAAMLFAVLWVLLIYCPVAHMVWGPGGLLGQSGELDFAGGTVVHITSGTSALLACLVLGRRMGLGSENMAPHNILLTMIGGSLLWMGWFCFNGGSALSAGPTAALAILNSQIAASAALVSWTLAEWKLHGKPSLLGALSGAIAGLVVITPACGFVTVSGALVMGLIGGVICLWAVNWPKHHFKYDDALDVWAIHGIGGIVGAFLTGIFATRLVGGPEHSGLLDGNWHQLLVQSKAIGVIVLWTIVATALILVIVQRVCGLRVSPDVEREGLDIALHGEMLHD
ncbi:ammonium transporter [Gluconacetobacter azotocaptans DSM 13594]|nr:ammonium transporter [Gluconacetobacter azotocaptans DSM 13594]